VTPLFKKLNWKGEDEIVVVNAPSSFQPELAALDGVRVVRDPAEAKAVRFALAFVTKQADVDRLSSELAGKAEGDAILWFAYPKQRSKNYTCEFHRDTGWAVLGTLGFEGVRMVALDADWSALRFRRARYIRTMTRDPKRAGSAEGKQRAGEKRHDHRCG
jgi:hypothetical protein